MDADRTAPDVAYAMGRELGEALQLDLEEDLSLEEREIAVREWLENYTQTAEYANDVLPELRELAGYEDPHRIGTYTYAPEGMEEELSILLDEVLQLWEEGIVNAFLRI